MDSLQLQIEASRSGTKEIGRRPKRAGREPTKQRPGRTGGDGHGKTRSDTMLGKDKLYSIGAKGHIYIHV
jgi:hypothetical protein